MLSGTIQVPLTMGPTVLDERVGVILDPLVSHTGHKGHKEIFRKIWLWRKEGERVRNQESGLEGTTSERWIGMRDLYADNGHNPHKGLVSAGFDECGEELGEKGKGMVLEGDPCKHDQNSSRTLRSVWRGRTKYCCQDWNTDVTSVHVIYRGKRHG
jgi:hypothetical protein